MNILDVQSSPYNPKLPLWEQLTHTDFGCRHTPSIMPGGIIQRVEKSIYAPLQFGLREVYVGSEVTCKFQYSSMEFTETTICVTFGGGKLHLYTSWEDADRFVRLEYQLLGRNPAVHS